MQIGMEPLVIDWAKEEPKMGQIIATRAIDVTKIRPPTTAHKTQTNKHESTCSFD